MIQQTKTYGQRANEWATYNIWFRREGCKNLRRME